MNLLRWNTVPPLRFSEFSGHWERKLLSEIGSIRTGPFGSLLHEKDYVDQGTPIITVEHLGDQGIQHVNLPLVSDEDKKRLSGYILDAGDIVFSRVGSVDRNSIVTPKERGWLFSGRLLRIRLCQKKTNPKFVSLSLQQEYTQYRIRAVAVGQTMPSLNTEILKRFSVLIPPRIEEQQKIASFLSSIDTRIEQLEKKKSLFEQYKKGLMQKLFSQEIRFKDDQGNEYPEWEVKRLREIATFFSGGTPKTTNKDYYKGDIPFIKSGEIGHPRTQSKISTEGLENSSAKMIKKGDILYALYGGQSGNTSGATCGEVAISRIDGAINQAVMCIRTHLNQRFLCLVLQHKKNHIVSTYIQGGQGNLSATIVSAIEIGVPVDKEQQEIADFLSAIDRRIEFISEQISQIREYKKGLLQQMFV